MTKWINQKKKTPQTNVSQNGAVAKSLTNSLVGTGFVSLYWSRFLRPLYPHLLLPDGWMDGLMDEWMDGWMDGRMEGGMDGWMNGWMDGFKDEFKDE